MKSYEEHLNSLLTFVQENRNESAHSFYGFSKDEEISYLAYCGDFINDLIIDAVNKNKRIHSEEVATSIEEVCAIWEVR